jgi:hypothetical protein
MRTIDLQLHGGNRSSPNDNGDFFGPRDTGGRPGWSRGVSAYAYSEVRPSIKYIGAHAYTQRCRRRCGGR